MTHTGIINSARKVTYSFKAPLPLRMLGWGVQPLVSLTRLTFTNGEREKKSVSFAGMFPEDKLQV